MPEMTSTTVFYSFILLIIPIVALKFAIIRLYKHGKELTI